MVTLQLTNDEARLLGLLLKRAGDEFSNHGCNDFNLQEELQLPEDRASDLARELRGAMVTHGILSRKTEGVYFMDWMLFLLFEQKVQEGLTSSDSFEPGLRA